MGQWTTAPVVLFVLWVGAVVAENYPANEYEYSLRRDQLIQAELAFEGKRNEMTKDEQLVDHYLQHLKWTEFERTRDRFLPALSLNETIMEEIMNTEVYKALQKMPKGGSMHSHENHEVGKRELLEIVWKSADFQYLWMTPENFTSPWKLRFATSSPGNEWIRVQESNYKMEDILKEQTLFGILSNSARDDPTNSGLRWKEMDPLWGRASVLIDNVKIKEEYLKALYKKNLDEGVQYIETRKSVGAYSLYKVDPNVTENNGIVNLETEENLGELEINMTETILKDFIKKNPSFIGHKRITYSTRKIGVEKMRKNMEVALRLHKKYPNHLLGFDMVGQEDAGNSHIYFLENFMEQYNPDTKKSKIPFYQHTAETNWGDDLIASKQDADPVATAQNAYEAVLLGSKRVGHGLGYIKHPYLLQMLKEKDVAVEICPISNQILGYIVDLRNHPAINYIRNGIPVVLGTDDPGTFGYDYFTIDWYSIFMAWGLDLTDLKQLAIRALQYSGMSKEEKGNAMKKFDDAWKKYIADTKANACAQTFSETAKTGRIIPRVGLKAGGTKVHVFGRKFDQALNSLCKDETPKCRFGDKETNAVYISNNHLVCNAPPQDTLFDLIQDKYGDVSVNVSVSLSNGEWINVDQQFTYNQDPIVKTTTTATPSSASFNYHFSMLLTIPIFFLGFLLKI